MNSINGLSKQILICKLIYGENDTIDDFISISNGDEQLARESFFDAISIDILVKGFDGRNDYYLMYWFMKGTKADDDIWESLMKIHLNY